jgi:hypothetical protein
VSHASWPVTMTLPSPGSWDFGDYRYALEPLTLPHPGTPAASAGAFSPAEVEDACLAFLAQARAGVDAVPPTADDQVERLFWFRWIVGHHVSFIIWRLIADALARLAAGDGDRERLSEAVPQYVRCYGGMLLYTGSCDRVTYRDVIRPSMYRQHSMFSGTWAPDYAPVRSLFRGRNQPPVTGVHARQLAGEVRLVGDLHNGVAAKLVAGGRSLLQDSVVRRNTVQPRNWGAVFDCYFLTLRAPVSHTEIVVQLLRRQKAVLLDLVTNGLYPVDVTHDLPAELCGPAAVACADELTESLCRVAGLAAGLPLDRVNKELGLP